MSTPRSASDKVVDEQEKRLDEEMNQLLKDIRRIGPTYPDPEPRVLFGELFDDDEAQQYYEALVGTLKSAKKRGAIHFKGQMLLKGMSDKVVISIMEDGVVPELEPPPTKITPNFRRSKKPKPKSPIKERVKEEIDGTFSDTEAAENPEYDLKIVVASDSETDPIAIQRSPRRRLVVPPIFLKAQSEGRLPPPSPRRFRRKKFPKTTPTRKPLVHRKWSEQPHHKPDTPPPALKKPPIPPARPTVVSPPKSSSPPKTSQPIKKDLSSEAKTRMEDEVTQLLIDIRRVGSNPGEPNVTFGELFDDEDVQNTYEALVGTLRSAKRQGLINFKGQMLLKGMHDKVVISVVE